MNALHAQTQPAFHLNSSRPNITKPPRPVDRFAASGSTGEFIYKPNYALMAQARNHRIGPQNLGPTEATPARKPSSEKKKVLVPTARQLVGSIDARRRKLGARYQQLKQRVERQYMRRYGPGRTLADRHDLTTAEKKELAAHRKRLKRWKGQLAQMKDRRQFLARLDKGDANGWGLWSDPQRLLNKLGKTHKPTVKTSKYGDHITIKSKDKSRELHILRAKNGQTAYTYRKKTELGWDSQVFFPGTKATVVTRNTREDGWSVRRTKGDLRGLPAAKKGQVPQKFTAEARVKKKGSLEDVKAQIKTYPNRRTVLESEEYKRFRQRVKGQRLTIVAYNSSEQHAKGKTGKSVRRMVVRAADGTRFEVDASGKAVISYHDPSDPSRSQTTVVGKKSKLVIRPDGVAYYANKDDKEPTATGKVPGAIGLARDGAKGMIDLKDAVKTSKYLPHALRVLRSGEGLKRTFAALKLGTKDSRSVARLAKHLNRVSVGLGALRVGASAIDGKVDMGAIKAVFDDAKGIHRALSKGGGGRVLPRGAARRVLGFVSRWGHVVGGAVGGFQTVQQIVDGKYAKAAITGVQTAGTFMALAGGSVLGPIGVGVMLLGLGAGQLYDFYDRTHIAPNQLDPVPYHGGLHSPHA